VRSECGIRGLDPVPALAHIGSLTGFKSMIPVGACNPGLL
jgi:hypothetical protein